KPAEGARQHLRFVVKRDEVRMLHAVPAEHLLHQQERIGNDLDLGGPFGLRDGERLEETGVLRDIVRRRAEVAADLDDLAGIRGHVDAVTCWAGITARCTVDKGCDFHPSVILSRGDDEESVAAGTYRASAT